MRVLARFATPILVAAAYCSCPVLAQTSGSMNMPMAGGGQGKAMSSPAETASVTLDGKAIKIHYNSPRMRGRTVMGGLVPYGQVWRTGANPATSFVTEGNVRIGDLNVPAGKYTLYTLPAAAGTPWMLIINKQTGQWGTEYSKDQDLGRTKMQASTLPGPQENMTISFEHTTKNSTELHVRWEKADEWVKVESAQ
ncbi:MAG TPA: DUF2911 domain-containing protein [Acidobacteriaceae bacterium]|jgi:hypothetical protein|nr:DUF2911 domain-containing protein [Acidobacteriaceae bacterium]